jgi:hypothetical protein
MGVVQLLSAVSHQVGTAMELCIELHSMHGMWHLGCWFG